MLNPAAPNYQFTPIHPARPQTGYRPWVPAPAPLVSIITPVYSRVSLLRDTARTVFGQSLQSFEWILVDDASPESECGAILDELSSDPRVNVLRRHANGGPSVARNVGIAAARGEFVFFVDADDLLEPTTLEKLMWYLISHPEQGFVGSYNIGFEAQQYLYPLGFAHGSKNLDENLSSIMVMIRRELLLRAGGFDHGLRTMEDWDLWLRLASLGHWGGTVPEYLTWYRRRLSDSSALIDESDLDKMKLELRRRYPRLFAEGIPWIPEHEEQLYAPLDCGRSGGNPLAPQPRIMLLLPWLSLGGADRFNLDVVLAAKERGVEVTVVTTDESDHPWAHEFTKLTSDVFCLNRFVRVEWYPAFLTYLINSRKPDVFLISGSEAAHHLLPYLKHRCPDPLYIDCSHLNETGWQNGGHPRRVTAVNELLDHCVVTSEYLKRWIVDRGVPSERATVITTNIDTTRFAPSAELRSTLRMTLGITDDQVVILYPARFANQKQPHVMLDTIRQLHENGHRIVTLCAGDGPRIKEAQTYVQLHQLQSVIRILGAIPADQMPALYAASDICFLPSESEGISLASFEALATGIPVVSANVGGQPELITPECGRLIRRGRSAAEEIQRYVHVLTELILNKDLRHRLGAAGRALVEERYRMSAMGEALFGVFQRARESRSDPAMNRGQSISPALAEEMGKIWVEKMYLHRGFMHAQDPWHRERRKAEFGLRAAPLGESPPVDGAAEAQAGDTPALRDAVRETHRIEPEPDSPQLDNSGLPDEPRDEEKSHTVLPSERHAAPTA